MAIYSFLTSIWGDLPTLIAQWTSALGIWFYFLLFFIIFAETGLVILPFLPGDSLLFAVGATAALPEAHLLHPIGLMALVILAAFLGDITNYTMGRWIGDRIIESEKFKFINRKHIERTEIFFKEYGGRTVLFARFVPIVRTYAPFISGVSKMPIKRFLMMGILGSAFWSIGFISLGYLFGNRPEIRENFKYAIVAIIVISVAPAIIAFSKKRLSGQKGKTIAISADKTN